MSPADCNCLALRQATRRVTALYDAALADVGLRATQYSILARLERKGPLGVLPLADELVVDRTTLARNLAPLRRDRLVSIEPSPHDGRGKLVQLTAAGRRRLAVADRCWARAQRTFEKAFGARRARTLRGLLAEVVAA